MTIQLNNDSHFRFSLFIQTVGIVNTCEDGAIGAWSSVISVTFGSTRHAFLGQLEPAPACVVNVISDIAFRMLIFSVNRGGVSMFYVIMNVGFRMFIIIEMFDFLYDDELCLEIDEYLAKLPARMWLSCLVHFVF